MTGRPLRIGILNVVLANGGDAAILLGLVRALRETFGSQTEISVFDAHPETTAPLYPELDVRPSAHLAVWPAVARGPVQKLARWTKWLVSRPLALARARQSEPAFDAFVSTGGTYFTGHYWLGPRLYEFALARAMGVPYALYTQSVGPFETPPEKLAEVFRDARAVLLRDERSEREVLRLAPQAETAVRADAAFALADRVRLGDAAGRVWPERPRVAVSVREWPYAETTLYADAIRATVTHLVRERGAEVVFASTCQGNAAYRYDDGAEAEQMAAGLPEDVRAHVSVARDYFRPEALMDLYAACDLVIATRMHAAILALCAGTPVVPVAYEFKTEELFARLGRADWVEHIERTTPASMVATVEQAITALPDVRADLFAHVETMRADALGASDLLRDAFTDVVHSLPEADGAAH